MALGHHNNSSKYQWDGLCSSMLVIDGSPIPIRQAVLMTPGIYGIVRLSICHRTENRDWLFRYSLVQLEPIGIPKWYQGGSPHTVTRWSWSFLYPTWAYQQNTSETIPSKSKMTGKQTLPACGKQLAINPTWGYPYSLMRGKHFEDSITPNSILMTLRTQLFPFRQHLNQFRLFFGKASVGPEHHALEIVRTYSF